MVSRNYQVKDGPGPSAGLPAAGPSTSGSGGGGGDLTPRTSAARIANEIVRHGRFQYLGDRPLEVTDSLKGYRANRGSSTDTIYRTESNSHSGWWKDNERGWRIFRWSLAVLAVLLVLGLVIYFLMIDMQMMAPVVTKSKENYEGKTDGRWTTDSSGSVADDVVSLDGDVILDLGDVTYHEGKFHVTPEQSVPHFPPAIATSNASNESSRPDFIEIVPAPNLGTSTMSGETDNYDQPTATHRSDLSQLIEDSTSNVQTTINIGEIYNNTQTVYPLRDISADFLYATSQLLNKMKATTQHSQEKNINQDISSKENVNKHTSESNVNYEQTRKQNGASKGNRNKQGFVRATTRSPIFPTVPTPLTIQHTEETGTPQNDSEGLCFSPRLPMCRGVLPYDLTTLPMFPGLNHLSDIDAALPYFEMILESGCSPRARQFVCSLLEPECQPMGDSLILPCRTACKAVSEDCSDFILETLDLSQVFQCDLYPDADSTVQCINFARGDKCLKGEYRCPDGTCIPSRWQCDSVYDCPFAADELNCTHCNAQEFRCEADHKCIPTQWKCDSQRDCVDGSDENNCPAIEGCDPGQFQCEDQTACIPKKWLCDGSPQCADKSDEKDCSNIAAAESVTVPRLTGMPHSSPCPPGELRCLDGRCITLQQLCDSKQDCSDGADEVNCGDAV